MTFKEVAKAIAAQFENKERPGVKHETPAHLRKLPKGGSGTAPPQSKRQDELTELRSLLLDWSKAEEGCGKIILHELPGDCRCGADHYRLQTLCPECEVEVDGALSRLREKAQELKKKDGA